MATPRKRATGGPEGTSDARQGAPADSDGRRKFASPDEVQAAANAWSEDVLLCRDVGHHWRVVDASHVARLHYYRVTHGCTRCGMSRYRELSESGMVYASSYVYPDGYLAKGLGRIAGPEKGLIRLASIWRTGTQEIKRRARDEDMPRYGATKRAIEDEA